MSCENHDAREGLIPLIATTPQSKPSESLCRPSTEKNQGPSIDLLPSIAGHASWERLAHDRDPGDDATQRRNSHNWQTSYSLADVPNAVSRKVTGPSDHGPLRTFQRSSIYGRDSMGATNIFKNDTTRPPRTVRRTRFKPGDGRPYTAPNPTTSWNREGLRIIGDNDLSIPDPHSSHMNIIVIIIYCFRPITS